MEIKTMETNNFKYCMNIQLLHKVTKEQTEIVEELACKWVSWK